MVVESNGAFPSRLGRQSNYEALVLHSNNIINIIPHLFVVHASVLISDYGYSLDTLALRESNYAASEFFHNFRCFRPPGTAAMRHNCRSKSESLRRSSSGRNSNSSWMSGAGCSRFMICVTRALVMCPRRANSDWSATAPSRTTLLNRFPGSCDYICEPVIWRVRCRFLQTSRLQILQAPLDQVFTKREQARLCSESFRHREPVGSKLKFSEQQFAFILIPVSCRS